MTGVTLSSRQLLEEGPCSGLAGVMILKPAPTAAFSWSSRLLLAQPAATMASARVVNILHA